MKTLILMVATLLLAPACGNSDENASASENGANISVQDAGASDAGILDAGTSDGICYAGCLAVSSPCECEAQCSPDSGMTADSCLTGCYQSCEDTLQAKQDACCAAYWNRGETLPCLTNAALRFPPQ